MLLLPLVFIPAAIIAPMLISNNRAENVYNIYFEENINEKDSILEELIQKNDNFTIVSDEENFDLKISKLDQNEINVEYKSDENDSNEALLALNTLLMSLSNQKMAQELEMNNIDSSSYNINLNVTDIAEVKGSQGDQFIAFMLPLVLSLMIAMGPLAHGASVVAGEKEKGTIESSLMLPVKRVVLLLVKFASVFLSSIFMTIATLIGITGAVLAVNKLTDISINLYSEHYLYMILIGIVGSLLFSSIYIGISIIAKGTEEANNYVTIVSLVAASLMVVGGMTLEKPGIYYTPFVNMHAILSDAFTLGENVAMVHIGLVILTNLIFTIICLIVDEFLLNREDVVLGK